MFKAGGYTRFAYGTVPTWQDSRPLLPRAGGILTIPPAFILPILRV